MAVLAARLDLSDMNAIIQRRTGDRQTDDAFLVNTSHLFVTQPRLNSDPAVLSRGVHTVAVQRCLSGATGVVRADDYRGRSGHRQLHLAAGEGHVPDRQGGCGRSLCPGGGVRPMGHPGGRDCAAGDRRIIAVALARTITRPCWALQAGAARFGRGELDVRLPETAGDELGALAHEFNIMAAALSREQTLLRHRLERMYGLSSDLICALGFDGYFKEVNPAFERVLGYRQDEMLDVPFIEFVHPDDRAATQAAAATLAEGQTLAGLRIAIAARTVRGNGCCGTPLPTRASN